MAAVDYFDNGLTPTSLSPNASFGSLLDPKDSHNSLRPTAEEVDALLNALESAANNDSFAPTDGSFVSKMIVSELPLEPLPVREAHFSGVVLENSLSGMPPLTLDDFGSDSNLTFDLDDQFKRNSMILDQFMFQGVSQEKDQEEGEDAEEETIDYGYGEAAPTLALKSVEDHPVESYQGKRRLIQRRGSMPTMHVKEFSYHYENHNVAPDYDDDDDEDPFEPTPIKEPPQGSLHVDMKKLKELQGTQGETPSADDDDEDAYSVQPEKRRRALRRGSMPTMHIRYSVTREAGDLYGAHEDNIEPMPLIKVNGRMPRRGSSGSFYSSSTSMSLGQTLSKENPFAQQVQSQDDSHIDKNRSSVDAATTFDTNAMMIRLQKMMQASMTTQKALQTWDKKLGLPKSHSQTMVNSSRSRKQLQIGAILPKWDGTPLINRETELGKPKPRSNKAVLKSGLVGHAKMKRRMSAPTSSGFDF